MVPWETANDVALSGEFSSSSARIALDNATMRFGSSTAKGSVAMALSGKRGVLEGTLAYDVLDLTALVSEERDGRPQLFFSAHAGASKLSISICGYRRNVFAPKISRPVPSPSP